MAVRLLIPTALQRYAGNQDEIEVRAATVREALDALAGQFPDLRNHLFGEQGQLRSFVNVYVGNEDMRALQGLDTPVKDGDELSIVPSIAGGVGVLEAEQAGEVALSNDEYLRYSRHLIMPEVGLEGQKKLKAASVLCIGAGGLGSPLAMYLAAAGVGTIGIVDFDVVDFTNLQRQIIHGTEDVGRSKLQSATETLQSINPFVNVIGFETRLSSENALDIFRDFDIVVDGTDNFPTRYLVNDACVLLGKPNVYGSIFRFEGQASVFWAEKGPCYRCLYPEPPPPGLVPSCAEGGVLGILPGIIGVIQATEAAKLILGTGEPLVGRLLLFNALKMQFRELKLRRDPACPLCGENPTIHELIDYEQFCGIPQQAAAQELASPWEITVRELKALYDRGERPIVLDVREPNEWQIARIPHTLLIPMDEVPSRLNELPKDQEIILHCRSGVRSMKVLEYLRGQGYTRLKNLKGGVLAWSEEIDPTVPKY
jgi:molybdopterin/thiamine biosynthesis adenylyltransferase/rhodanese-related sulfurtransferase/molybdopterin converting factor small subunit